MPFFTTQVSASIIPGFNRLEYNYILPATSREAMQPGQPFYDPQNTYDRFLGMFDGAEVWVKPWMPAGYLWAYDPTQPKPLQVRVPKAGPLPSTTVSGATSMGGSDLRLVLQFDQFPFQAQAMVRDYGISASGERWNGVAMYLNSVSSYTTPSGLAP